MNPDEQLPFVAQSEAALVQYDADIQAYNTRIPLSPLVELLESDFAGDLYRDWYIDRIRRSEGYQERLRRRGAQLWNRYRRDHPQACGGAIVSVPDQPFRFLDLPQELRDMVYRLLLYRSRSLVQMEQNGSAIVFNVQTDEGSIDVRLFAVCKQVYEEATNVFFGQNIIKIDLGQNLAPPMFRKGPQATAIHKLRRIEIHLPLYSVPEAARLIWLLQLVCQALSIRSHLTEVTIIPFCPTSWYKPAMHQAMDNVLETLTALRGVGRVFFSGQDDLDMIGLPPQVHRSFSAVKDKSSVFGASCVLLSRTWVMTDAKKI
ncbi:MAG: hypothetical protein Q9225_003610 [Loekoesia sp. 1 TL-2023]